MIPLGCFDTPVCFYSRGTADRPLDTSAYIGPSRFDPDPSPTPLVPLAQMRTLLTQGGVAAGAGIYDGVIPVGPEDPVADIVEQFLESTWLPGLADPAGEPLVADD